MSAALIEEGPALSAATLPDWMRNPEANAVRAALRVAHYQIGYYRGERKATFNGAFANRLIDAALSGRPVCEGCHGTGLVDGDVNNDYCQACDRTGFRVTA